MGALNIPAGVRIIGGNIVPKNVDIVSGAVAGSAWTSMVLNWDWDGWVKPQIDYMCGNQVGANCIRIIGAQVGILAGLYTQDSYDTKILQIAQYCKDKGVYFYACCGGGDAAWSLAGAVTATSDQIAESYATTLKKLQSLGTVIGCDVMQEMRGQTFSPAAVLIDIVQLLRTKGVTLPLTLSSYRDTDGADFESWIVSVAPYLDFIDVHCYTYPIPKTRYKAIIAANPTMDFIVGEFGRAQSAGTEDSRSADLSELIDWSQTAAESQVRGALLWACTDQQTITSEQFGAYTDTFTPREYMLRSFRKYTKGSVIWASRSWH